MAHHQSYFLSVAAFRPCSSPFNVFVTGKNVHVGRHANSQTQTSAFISKKIIRNYWSSYIAYILLQLSSAYALQPPTCKETNWQLTSLLSCLPDPCCLRQPLVVAVFKEMWGAQSPTRITLGAHTDKSVLVSQWEPLRQHSVCVCACVHICVSRLFL